MKTLEEKLKSISKNISKILSESELPKSIHGKLLFYDLEYHGLISGAYNEKAFELGTYLALFENKLGYKTLSGLETDYVAFKKTPLSPEAQEDIEKYEKLKESAKEYLKTIIKDRKQVYEGIYDLNLKEYVEKQTPNLDRFRRSSIIGAFSAQIKYELKIKFVEPKDKIGNYLYKDIKKAFKKL